MTLPRIASTLKARRIELGLTQQQLADKLRIKQSNVSQIESGEKGLSIPMLLRYCKALKLELTFTPKD